MEALWNRGACSVREIQETFPAKGRPWHIRHGANDGVPAGGKEGAAMREADQQRKYF